MPVRELTQQEVREWLGSGIVLSGFKRPKSSPQPSTSTSEADNRPQILGAKNMKSKELKEMEQEDLDSEPSLDKMLDWSNPETYAGLGRLARNLRAKDEAAAPPPSSSGAKQDKNSTKK